jgi:Fic family protein
MDLIEFVQESNKIEGIDRSYEPSRFNKEIKAHERLLEIPTLSSQDIKNFVSEIDPTIKIRDKTGMNVSVGNYFPPKGSSLIRSLLDNILKYMSDNDAYTTHIKYERLHPFMDVNGRSGRAIWAWQMSKENKDPFYLGFLHTFYYQTLEHSRRAYHHNQMYL